MQLSALTENLATVRGELKTTQEKLFSFEIIKNEKAGLFNKSRSLIDNIKMFIRSSRASNGDERRKSIFIRTLSS